VKAALLIGTVAVLAFVTIALLGNDDGSRIESSEGTVAGLAVDPDFAGDEAELRRAAERCVALWNDGSDADELWAAQLQRRYGRAYVSVFVEAGRCRLMIGMPETGEVRVAGYDQGDGTYLELAGEELEHESPERGSGENGEEGEEGEEEGAALVGGARVGRSGALDLTDQR
jgi:hypothetical protein